MIKQALSFTPASAGSAWLSRALLDLAVSPSLPGPGRAPWPPDASLSSPSRHQQPSRPYPPLHRPSPQQTVGRPHRGRQISADDPCYHLGSDGSADEAHSLAPMDRAHSPISILRARQYECGFSLILTRLLWPVPSPAAPRRYWPEELVLGPTPPDSSAPSRLQPFSRPLSRKPPHRDGLCTCYRRAMALPYVCAAAPTSSQPRSHARVSGRRAHSDPVTPGHPFLHQAGQTGHDRVNIIQSPGNRESLLTGLEIMHACATTTQLCRQARARNLDMSLDDGVQDNGPRQLEKGAIVVKGGLDKGDRIPAIPSSTLLNDPLSSPPIRHPSAWMLAKPNCLSTTHAAKEQLLLSIFKHWHSGPRLQQWTPNHQRP